MNGEEWTSFCFSEKFKLAQFEFVVSIQIHFYLYNSPWDVVSGTHDVLMATTLDSKHCLHSVSVLGRSSFEWGQCLFE